MTGHALYQSEDEKIRLVERNLFLQYQEVVRLVGEWKDTLRLAPQTIRDLHRLAMQDIYSCAGEFRRHSVKILGSHHTPPRWNLVGRREPRVVALNHGPMTPEQPSELQARGFPS